MRSMFMWAGLVLALVGFAPRAYAAPITFEISATASGQIGGVSFSDALVQLKGNGDTAAVVDLAGGFFAVALSNSTVTISGVGTATITDPTEILSFPFAIIDPDDEVPPFPLVIFGRTDSPPDLDGITGIGAVATNALAGSHPATSATR